MFATPITDEETKITTVENNGHAMAPYMMSVGLWVGCLAFCLMYPLTEYKGKLKSGFAWWASKASVLYPVAILQGVLLILLLHVFDGFTSGRNDEDNPVCSTDWCMLYIYYVLLQHYIW